MYIFWDNSNIQYAGLNSVRPSKSPMSIAEGIAPTSKAC